jgi:hypothetical protein
MRIGLSNVKTLGRWGVAERFSFSHLRYCVQGFCIAITKAVA